MTAAAWALAAAIGVMIAMSAAGVAYARTRRRSIEDYVSARGSVGGATAMATMAASLMGAWILFSPAEAATWAGAAALIGYGLGQAAPIAAFAVLGPRLRELAPNGRSLTEYVWRRYGRPMHLAVLAIVALYMFTFLAAEMGAVARAVGLAADAPLALTLALVGAATLAYTVYGGLRASIFTDSIQFAVIVPLLIAAIIAAIAYLGGWTASFDTVREANPALLDVTQLPGIEFGLTLVIAILAANLFHQGLWQRVYAAKSDADIRRGFIAAGVIVVPAIIGAGLFGLWAVGAGLVTADQPAAIALFTLALELLPGWALTLLVALALMLVMSSMDTLLNGMASVFTTDLSQMRPGMDGRGLLRYARVITALLIVPAAVVGYLFDSVLYLFLIADLVCAGAMVPAFAGMWSRRLTGAGALISAAAGILAGALFFPTSAPPGGDWWTWDALTGVWHILESGNLLASFLSAVVVSSLATLLFILAGGRGNEFPLESLAGETRSLERAR